MTTQQAIEILRYHNEWRRGAETKQTNPVVVGIAIDTVIEALSKPQWISVEDRLPDDNVEEVLATDGHDYVVGEYYEGGPLWIDYDALNENVTHWMPLPELPAKENK